MKRAIAILAIGIMLSGIFGGCIGGAEKETAVLTPDDGNKTTNQTIVAIFHDEKTGTVDDSSIITGSDGAFTFPVNNSAVKITILFTATNIPGAMGCGLFLNDAEGNEYTYFSNGDEVKIEFKAKDIKKGGFGDWSGYFVPQLPDVMSTYKVVIDVFGIAE
ncbi:MAG: hypothetical protein PHH26_07455 [Candidatus Thermoplasmatota archaeon]|nr:hypothetical protein [Candidatus Thermoplasmatota archaeon]